MEKKKIKKIYQEKIKIFKHHNFLYFEKNKPILTDGDFDKLKNEIIELEKSHKYLKDKSLKFDFLKLNLPHYENYHFHLGEIHYLLLVFHLYF